MAALHISNGLHGGCFVRGLHNLDAAYLGLQNLFFFKQITIKLRRRNPVAQARVPCSIPNKTDVFLKAGCLSIAGFKALFVGVAGWATGCKRTSGGAQFDKDLGFRRGQDSGIRFAGLS